MIASRLALCALLLAAAVFAQDFRATLLGQVLDSQGAAIPKATIKATKTDTNVTNETITNDEGIYTLPGLNPGRYTVTITAGGFQTVRRTDIVLQVAQKLSLPITMEVGAVTQEITVVGSQELIQTATASRGLVFDPVKMQEIPMNGRQAYMLMRLSPGVMFTQRTFGNTGFSGTRAWDVNGSFTMNGGVTGSNQFLLNGAPISTDGAFNLAPNVEAVEEMKVMVNTYDSQYGRSGGGHVSTTLKSGTNAVHGTLFDFWRNRILDANTRQNNALGVKRGFRNQHQFGGTVGFAVRQNTDFLFFSFEGWRERVPFPSNVSVPPMEIRGGDFSTFVPQGQTGIIAIYDPLTSIPCTTPGVTCNAGGLFRRTQFPGNRIPASRISPIGRAILGFYPAPNFQPQALANNFTRPDNLGKYRYEQPMARYDKVLNANNRFHFLFTFQDGSEYRDQNGFDPPARFGNMTGTVRRDINYIFSYDYTISPTRLLHIQSSYNRFVQNFPDVSDPDFTWDKVGIRNIPQVASFPTKLMPRVNVGGFSALFGNQFINQSSRQQMNFQINIAETRGRHSLKYGTEVAQLLRHNFSSGRSSGDLTFDNAWTRQFQAISQGARDSSSVASLLLGHIQSGNLQYNDTFLRREPYWAIFVQDDWRISNKLTLNLGLRYDIQFGLYEIQNRLNRDWDFSSVQPTSAAVIARWNTLRAATPTMPAPVQALVGGMTFAGVGGQPRRVYNPDLTNVQPRIGVAWNFAPKTVIRSGIGIFHRTVTQNNLTTGFSIGTPYINTLTASQFPSGGLTGDYSLENPWPGGVIRPAGASRGIETNIGTGVSYDSPRRRIPRTMQWSFTIERELPGSMVLEVSYVGSQTTKETVGFNWNAMPQSDWDAAQSNPNFYNQRVPNPFLGIFPTTVGRGVSPDLSRQTLLQPFPHFDGLTANLSPWGRTWYHGLQTRFEKRMLGERSRTGAMTWVMAYTWSKQMERRWRDNFSYAWRDPITQVTGVDRSHNLTFAGIWDLPFGKNRAFLNSVSGPVNKLIGGWTANVNLIYQSGVPLGAWTGWEFLCGDPLQNQRTESSWFFNDRSRFGQCWRQLRPFEYRQLPDRFHSIRAHTAPQIDLMVSKKTNIGERYQLEFRVEAFNAFNTPIRGDAPSGNPASADFGILPVAQLNFSRNVQMGMRVRF
ncbi:MAG: TonB-dependent receptor [Acidimicrobiia bacterium]|nr:TonB-dependent receptor [Acidimicrobiia bacterium]